jgi:hypothetical protein
MLARTGSDFALLMKSKIALPVAVGLPRLPLHLGQLAVEVTIVFRGSSFSPGFSTTGAGGLGSPSPPHSVQFSQRSAKVNSAISHPSAIMLVVNKLSVILYLLTYSAICYVQSYVDFRFPSTHNSSIAALRGGFAEGGCAE